MIFSTSLSDNCSSECIAMCIKCDKLIFDNLFLNLDLIDFICEKLLFTEAVVTGIAGLSPEKNSRAVFLTTPTNH